MARIVVCGFMIRHPVAGNLLAFFHYVLGLYRLGHDVAYLEESGWPYSCYDPVSRHWQDHPHSGLRVVRALAAEYGMHIPICYVNRDSGQVEGADWDGVKQMLRAADLLLNVGGVCWLPEFQLCRRRALIDMDPFFTQVAQFGAKLLGDYHVHFSYGANIGRPGCTIPSCGIDWLWAAPPVVSEIWQGAMPAADAPLTTVANWSSYGGLMYEGQHYGQKDEEFLRLLGLPRRTPQRLELALSGAQTEFERLRAAGWSVRDAGEEVSTDVATYRSYIAGSRAEFSVAKNAYVKTHSGWFSDRSVCYLASGLPVILQDTGFSDSIPVGRGLLAFSTADEALDCIAKVNADYDGHRLAARDIAERFFDHRVVLPRLLDAALTASTRRGRPQASDPLLVDS